LSAPTSSRRTAWLDSPRVVFSFVALMFLLYLSPYVIKGWDVWINQFDNLDQLSYIGIFDGGFRGQFFPTNDMPEYYLPGMEPIFRVSILSVQKLFWQLGFFPGYVVNEMMYRILGFIGFYLLLRRLFMRELPRALPALLALAYAFLPFWPQGGLSIAGLPLLAWALVLLWRREKVLWAYMVVVLYTLYSSFFLTGVFVLTVLFLVIIALAARRAPFRRLIFALALMTLLYVAVNYSFFVIAFVEKIPTNRSEIQLTSKSLSAAFHGFFLPFFTQSHLHAPSYHQYLLLPVSVLGLLGLWRGRACPWRRLMLLLAGFIVFCAAVYALYRFKPFNNLYTRLGFGFDYSRFYFLTPPVWYVMAGLAMAHFIGAARWQKPVLAVCLLLLLAQLGINYGHSGWKVWAQRPTLREVMAVEQFGRIEDYLERNEPGFDKQTVRIGCVGFSPSVANFNGYRTLGAYCPSYPLHLKHEFLDILSGEMARNNTLKQYMEKWGSQLYLFDDRIFVHMLDQRRLQRNVRSITCELNLPRLRALGVDYLFCAVPVSNAAQVGLTPVVRDTGSYYHLYIYRL